MNRWYFAKYNKLGMDDIHHTIENKTTGELLRFHELDFDLVTQDINEGLITYINSPELDVNSEDILKEIEIDISLVERIFKDYNDIKCKLKFNKSIVYRNPQK